MTRLTTKIHDRDSAGLTYVYPVLSRRAGGVSLGINLNPNKACNWRCVYCQVPGLVFGNAPKIDIARLEDELEAMLAALLEGDYMQRCVPEAARVLKDVAFSGDGEPTSSLQFAEIVEGVGLVLQRRGLVGKVELVLITNGSLVHRGHVLRGIDRMRELGGVVWFKVDSATDEGLLRINDSKIGVARARENLEIAARLCPTWIQTMMLARAREGDAERRGFLPPSDSEVKAYLDFVRGVVRDRVPVRGVLLYGLARESHQPEAIEIAALPREWLEGFAEAIEKAGLAVKLSV